MSSTLLVHPVRDTTPPTRPVSRPVHDQDVALVGAACRLPGAADPARFWDLLRGGRDALAEIDTTSTPARFEPARLGLLRERASLGGVLDDCETWDAAFFRHAPAHAVRVDPQHRLALEAAWEAVEDAGLDARALQDRRVGVFTSTGQSGYASLLARHGVADVAAMLGTDDSALAGQVAQVLGVRGPAMAVAAGCSSSLLGVHLATQALRSGEIDAAVVVAATRWTTLDDHETYVAAKLLSPTGRCRFGDAASDGFVRSEGGVALVLRRVGDAREAGDRVYATVLGSAVAHNGASVGGLAAPSVDGQVTCLREAYRNAGVEPAEVDYVEAHGTGTPTGDPVEVEALSTVLGRDRPAGAPCLVGSAKTNVGHTESVAGAVGVLKVALASTHRWLPGSLHVVRPHDAFEEHGGVLQLLDVGRPWHGPRLAGVSATGLTGVNVHVVLGAAPDPVSSASAGGDPVDNDATLPALLPLSARGLAALHALADRYAGLLAAGEQTAPLADVCHAAGARRRHHEVRHAVVGHGRADLVRQLRGFAAAGPESPPHFDEPRTVMVFPGHGGEWDAMAVELAATSAVFRDTLRECCDALVAAGGPTLFEAMTTGRPLTGLAAVQPALWAFQVSLAAAWRAWGVTPEVVVGHSVGEIAAATVAGGLDVATAARIVVTRSALIAAAAAPGAMWWVGVPAAEVQAAVGDTPGVEVAVRNSDTSCVVAGEVAATTRVVETLAAAGAATRQIPVTYASHSPAMDALGPELVAALGDVEARTLTVPMWSTVHARRIDGGELRAEYWMANLRRPVRFADAVEALLDERPRTAFVEVSPHPTLTASIAETVAARGADAAVTASVRRDTSSALTLRAAVASLYAAGADLDWDAISPGRFVPLPTYPWQREHHWPEPVDDPPVPAPALASAVADASTSSATVPNAVAPGPVVPAVVGGPAATTTAIAEPAAVPPPASVPAPVAEPAPAATGPGEIVRSELSRVLGTPVARLDDHLPLRAYGVDSLVAVEVAARLTAHGFRVRSADILRAGTIDAVATRLTAARHAG